MIIAHFCTCGNRSCVTMTSFVIYWDVQPPRNTLPWILVTKFFRELEKLSDYALFMEDSVPAAGILLLQFGILLDCV